MRKALNDKGLALAGKAKIKCNTHGKVIWHGDLICSYCNKIYLIDKNGIFNHMLENGFCYCGKILIPSAAGIKVGTSFNNNTFTGRAICNDCALSFWTTNMGI